MRTEQKNKHMQEANRLAEMEYMKSREEMGVPSPSNETVLSYGTDEDPIDDYNDSEPDEDFETMFYKTLNGSEIQSLEFEGTVYVNGRERCVVRDGEKMKPSMDQLRTLWDEYVEGEGLYETKVEEKEPVDEAEMEEELNEIKRITKQLLGE